MCIRDSLYAEPVGGSRYWDAFVYTLDQKTLTLLEWVKGEIRNVKRNILSFRLCKSCKRFFASLPKVARSDGIISMS